MDDTPMNRLYKRVLCQAPIEQVFDALVTDSVVAEWMTADVELDPWVDGCIVVAVDGWPKLAGHVVAFEPPGRLVVQWQADDWRTSATLTFDLEESGRGCWVMIEEVGFVGDDEIFAQREVLWSHWLIRLAAVVARSRWSS
ncbi:MAG: SRPBCC domain-containing protein [Ilumatobacteraceae bacterium]